MDGRNVTVSFVPPGLGLFIDRIPALKRWAMVEPIRDRLMEYLAVLRVRWVNAAALFQNVIVDGIDRP